MSPYLTLCSGFPVLSVQNPVYNGIWKAILIWPCWSQCNSYHVQLLIGSQISSISPNSWLHSNHVPYSASWNIPLAPNPAHAPVFTQYLLYAPAQTFPPMHLLCTPAQLLLTPVTVRHPSDVPRCTQNFPQLSAYTPSSKCLFTSLKPLTILWGILKICLIYHSSGALNTVQNIMCLLNNLINKSAGHRQSKSIS